ncbi:MAG: methylmalonyl-CoA mutase, partial [Chitinophagia bacterium]|nr:methylmalonyl-CoA mutase [Chitinophagia bacterium]
SLHTNALDEAIALPTDFSARIARNTQIFLQEETKICKTVDPWAGSYYVEWLTDEMERKAEELIQTIDGLGGSVAAIEQGYMQEAISNSAYQYQKNIESKEKIIVGVNQFQVEQENPIPGFVIDDSIREVQSARLREIRTNRDAALAEQCMAAIRQSAIDGSNLMPAVIKAVENQCTLGEIAGELRKVFGEYRG